MLIIMALWASPALSQLNKIPSKDSLMIDPNVHYGQLENGFTYYIKHLKDAPSVEMSLLVKAGSFNQTKNQSIAAHLIEHLPFRSTKDFQGTNIKLNPRIKKYHINNFRGNTIMIHTVYKLKVPLSSGIEGISTGLSWFQNIGNMDLVNYDIKKEAGILRQEALRSGDFIDWNFSNSKRESKVFPCAADFSTFLYDVDNLSPIEVRKFYDKWYRPDRMGLTIIGNITNIVALEDQIKIIFSKLPIPKTANPSCDCVEEYLNSDGKFILIKKEPSGWIKQRNPPVEVFLDFRKKDPLLSKPYSTEALKNSLIWDAINKLIRQRLKVYNVEHVLTNQRKREKPFLQISFQEYNGKEKENLKKIIQILAQVNKFGFTPKEWINIRSSMLQRLTHKVDTNSISYWKSQLENHFLYHEILPKDKSIIMKNLIQSLSVEDLNTYIKENFKAIPDDISMLVPEENKALAYTKSEVRNWIQQAIEDSITLIKPLDQKGQQIIKLTDKPVMDPGDIAKLPFSDISSIRTDNDTGVKIIKLDNGIQVILNKSKTSKLQEKRIQIHGFTPKGAKCFPKKDYFSAINAPNIVQNGNAEVRKSVRVYIDNFTSGIEVKGKVDDIEKIFQLIYLSFKPPIPPTMLDYVKWKEKAEKMYFNPYFDLISNDFLEYKQAFLGDKSIIPRATKRFYGIKKTDYKKAYSYYSKLLGNAAGYTFIISGDFTYLQLITLSQKYLGNLPIHKYNQLEDCTKIKVINDSLPTAPLYKEFYAEFIKPGYSLRDIQYELSYIKKQENEFWNWKNRIKLIILSKFIQPQLENLRYEKKAGLYAPNFASTSFNPTLHSHKISIYLACQEDELDWLKQECQNIIKEIKVNGIKQKQFNEVVKNQVLPYYVTEPPKKLSNKEIFDYFRFGTPLINKQEQVEFIHSLTPEDIQETARKYFKKSNQYEFVMKNTSNDNHHQ